MNWAKHSIVHYTFCHRKKGKKSVTCLSAVFGWEVGNIPASPAPLTLFHLLTSAPIITTPLSVVKVYWPQHGLAMLLQRRGKPLTALELADASQSDKVWKESWSSSLSLSDLTLMDCFVVQRSGQELLSYITIYSVFAQQVPFPSLP